MKPKKQKKEIYIWGGIVTVELIRHKRKEAYKAFKCLVCKKETRKWPLLTAKNFKKLPECKKCKTKRKGTHAKINNGIRSKRG
jgi:transcription elongation factor Elf1